jgi:hypothetical protein
MSTTKKVASKAPLKKASHVLKVRADKSKAPSKAKKISIVKKPVAQEKTVVQQLTPAASPFFEKQTKKSLQVRPSFALALRYPFRFPINQEKLAVSTARYGGVLFMAIGALFTLFFANGSFGSGSQQVAAVLSNQATTTLVTSSANCEEILQYESLACKDIVNKKPPVTFDVTGTPTALVGTVSVRAQVAHAKSVTLVAFSQSLNKIVELGPMTNVGNNVWEFSWNTLSYNDGSFTLKAYVQNFYGAYDTVDTRVVTVDNVPLLTDTPQSTSDDSQPDNQTASTSSPLSTTNTTATLELLPSEKANEFRFKTTAPSATKNVKIYLRNDATNTHTLLGYAYKASTDSWVYRWDASLMPAGTYAVKAVAIQTDLLQLATPFVTVTKTAALEASVPTSAVGTSSLLVKPVLKPTLTFNLEQGQTLKNLATVKLDVASASTIEMYIQNRSALTKKFLGHAQSIDTEVWMYQFDTKKLPNGEYVLIAQVKNSFGSYETQSAAIKITNEVALALTPKEEERVTVLTNIAEQEKSSLVVVPVENKVTAPESATLETTLEKSFDAEAIAKSLVTQFKDKITAELQVFTATVRSGDVVAIDASKKRLDTLKQDILRAYTNPTDKEKLNEQLQLILTSLTKDAEATVQNTAKIIAERTKEKASKDSDKDGIADYDEVAFYKTSPFNADSDSDGFTDGAEILSGYNPTDATTEALVVYESPKESGVIREDILAVTSITTALADPQQTEAVQKRPEAIIVGKALPNSFVTLYIFSTPIVVTLKTDAEGNWNYRFDKELEHGEHQIYVGVTDNAGKIVAKSNPFSFVKEAQAFSPASGEVNVAAPVSVPLKSFLSEYMVYLVLSISVVAIGLVLILLGLHLDTRQRKYGAPQEETPKPA